MKILLAHQNFPGQFKHLCHHLGANPLHKLVFLTRNTEREVPGVQTVKYELARQNTPGIHHYVSELERGVLHGQAVVREVVKLRQEGFVPDVMVGHNGWGETMFLKDVYPTVPLLSYFEFYYRTSGADVGFDAEYPAQLDDRFRVRMKNGINWAGTESADWGLSPTDWQRSRYPEEVQRKTSVIHEGVDTKMHAPDPRTNITLPNGRRLTYGDEVVTYVSRNLEPYRGFHTFMRAIPKILEKRPNATILMVGGDEVSYGRRLADGRTYREVLTAEVPVDPERVFFLGRIPYDQFRAVLRVSAAHVYLTYPFVLSWSMLEAMSTGCLVIGSATPPVQEVIEDGVNGLLVDFFSTDQIAQKVDEVLGHPDRMASLRAAARKTVQDRYEVRQTLPQLLQLIDELALRRPPTVGLRPVLPPA